MNLKHIACGLLLSAALGCSHFQAARADANVSGKTARSVPTWLPEATVYEIFPRHFSASGDFAGVSAKLDELKDLGVTVLWFMPIHPIGEQFRKGKFGSPYSIKDYYAVDPNYGTLDDFKKLVADAHQRGMKVIMDLVANHTAWDSVMMTNKAFYKQDATGKIIPPVAEWTDVAGLNYDNAGLRQYMVEMLKFWVRDVGVDGFRCDVAYMVPTDFWETVRDELGKIKPDVLLLAEASKPELLVKAFDMDYSWPLHGTLNNVLLRDAPVTDFRKSWEESRRQFPKGSLHLRISDNHDEARAIARFGIRGALAAQVFMFTLDGVPLLYNGMEVGDATESGDPALFYEIPIFWQPKERPPLRSIYKHLIQLRKDHAALRSHDLTWLDNSAESSVVAFTRRGGSEEFLVLINFSNRPVNGSVTVANAGDFKQVNINGAINTPAGTLPNFQLEGYGWRIWKRTIK